MEFPCNNWYIEITEENKELLNEWKIKQKYNTPIDEYNYIKYIDYLGSGIMPGYGAGILITTEQFKEHILNITTEIKDYSYLEEIIDKINKHNEIKQSTNNCISR